MRRVSWEDRRTNSSILDEATIITQSQLQWIGHIICMSEPASRLPKTLFGQVNNAKQAPGGERDKRSATKINWESASSWEEIQRTERSSEVLFLKGPHTLNKTSPVSLRSRGFIERSGKAQPATIITYTCSHCNRICGSQTGLLCVLKAQK